MRALVTVLALLLPLGLPAMQESGTDQPGTVQSTGQDDPAWDDDAWEDDAWGEDDWDEDTRRFSGFVEGAFGTRIDDDPLVRRRNTLAEVRARVEAEWEPGPVTVNLKADVAYDGVLSEFDGNLRELTADFSIADSIDIKAGRQVLTWGTGDLVFLNDLFPKDFESFFAGRDDEYLKAPGNAVRITRYSDLVNVDFAWSPEFDSDIYLDGERFSFFSPLAGTNVAPQPPLDATEPSRSFANGEFALRLFKTVGSRELALYGYRGWFKQPSALTPSLQPTFAPLSAIGASLRQPLGKGLVSIETSYYDSRDDRDGDNPLIPNSQWRALLGYEWEARPRLTVGLQYYLEHTLEHDRLLANSPFPALEPEKNRHLLTNRLTWRSARERHSLSLFTFYSPSDQDFYLRPAYDYRHNDQWSLTAGASLFGGDEPQTFFNQLSDASNLYLRVRYNY